MHFVYKSLSKQSIWGCMMRSWGMVWVTSGFDEVKGFWEMVAVTTLEEFVDFIEWLLIFDCHIEEYRRRPSARKVWSSRCSSPVTAVLVSGENFEVSICSNFFSAICCRYLLELLRRTRSHMMFARPIKPSPVTIITMVLVASNFPPFPFTVIKNLMPYALMSVLRCSSW